MHRHQLMQVEVEEIRANDCNCEYIILSNHSGNPAGRPAGRKNAITMATEEVLEGEADAITRVCIDRAKVGDHHAMKLVNDRILPTRRGRPVQFDLPEIEGATDVTKAHGSILRACAAGVLTPEEVTSPH